MGRNVDDSQTDLDCLSQPTPVSGSVDLEECLRCSARIGVIDTDPGRLREYCAMFARAGLEVEGMCSNAREVRASGHRDLDVAVVVLEDDRLDALSFFFGRESFKASELLLIVRDDHLLKQAMKAAGFRVLLHGEANAEEIAAMTRTLAVRGRARALYRRCEDAISRWSERGDWNEAAPDAALLPSSRLYLAESRFRELFLRATLSTSRSKREAAARAGVPYRTFLDMLDRMNIP
jgi:hypothetical protein